jgi:hypothetical protein
MSRYFDDKAIVEQEICEVKTEDGEITGAVSLTVEVPKYHDATEIVLTYDQLLSCIHAIKETPNGT